MRVTTPSDRVQVIGRGQLRDPGACALCGNGTCDDGYVDLDIYYDWEGQVYLCMNCAKQVAETIGCLLPAESAHLESLNKTIAEELAQLKEDYLDAKSRLDVYDAAIAATVAQQRSTANAVEGAEPESGHTPEPVSAPDAGEPVAKKSVKSRRPNDPPQSSVRDRTINI